MVNVDPFLLIPPKRWNKKVSKETNDHSHKKEV
jgi:hypothetical protein